MKKQILSGALSLVLFASVSAQSVGTPVYLDDTKSVELRVEDALSRMTLEEKIAMIHAQSKFCSPGVSRLGIPEVWCTDGPHGIRPEVLWVVPKVVSICSSSSKTMVVDDVDLKRVFVGFFACFSVSHAPRESHLNQSENDHIYKH